MNDNSKDNNTNNGASKDDRRLYILREERPAKAIVALGVPLVMGMSIMVLYNLVDTFFIGLLHDDYQMAAVNLAYPVMMILIAISNVVGAGCASLISRSMGAGDFAKASHTLTAGFALTVVGSVIVAVAGLAFLPQVVRILGAKATTVGSTASTASATASTFDFTQQYVMIIFIGCLFIMGNYIFGQLLRSEGSVKYSIAGMVVGTAANIVLDPIFIFGLGMEIRGAAIATVLGNALGMAVSVWFYAKGKTLLKPETKYIRPTSEILKEVFWVGVPAGLETLLTSIAFVVNNNLAMMYGELTMAAMGIAQKIMTLGGYIYQGFAAGSQPIMGYNYGAKNYHRMLQVLRAGILLVSGIELFVMLIFGVFAPYLIDIFSDTPEVINTGSQVLRAFMCVLPFVGAVSMSRMSFQAMGKPQYAFGITLVRQLILYIPLLLLLNHAFGFGGMIWAQPITEVIMMAASVTLLVRVIRKEWRDQ